MSWLLEGSPLDSILITRLRYLGDVVMATPLLEVLHLGDPEIRIGFLAESQHGLVLKGHPLLNKLHLLDSRRRGSDQRARGSMHEDYESMSLGPTLARLRSLDYHLAVDLFFNPRSAWLLRFSGIPHRIGGTRGSRRFLFTHSVVTGDNPSRFDFLFRCAPGGLGEHLARLAPLVHGESGMGFLQWFQQQYSGKQLKPFLPREYWARQVSASLPWEHPVVLAPGATWTTKEWPLGHWKELVRGLLSDTNNPILVIQPPGREGFWEELGREIPSSRGGVLPVTGLEGVLGLLSQSALLVSVDGGIMHAGVGLGIPTLGLFGPTDPRLWFPYEGSGPFQVLATNPHCAPCDLHECDEFICLPDLKSEVVLTQCLRLLSNGGEGDRPRSWSGMEKS